jgi:hypothetical protein
MNKKEFFEVSFEDLRQDVKLEHGMLPRLFHLKDFILMRHNRVEWIDANGDRNILRAEKTDEDYAYAAILCEDGRHFISKSSFVAQLDGLYRGAPAGTGIWTASDGTTGTLDFLFGTGPMLRTREEVVAGVRHMEKVLEKYGTDCLTFRKAFAYSFNLCFNHELGSVSEMSEERMCDMIMETIIDKS